MLNVVDEFTRECLSISINWMLKSSDVVDVLSDLYFLRCVSEHIRSDSGYEVGSGVGRRRWCQDNIHRAREPVREWITSRDSTPAFVTWGTDPPALEVIIPKSARAVALPHLAPQPGLASK